MNKRNGFSLFEVLIAVSLSLIAMGALASVFLPLLKSQIAARKFDGIKSDSVYSLKTLRMKLNSTTQIYSPANPGQSSDVLSGCINYSSIKGSGVLGLINPNEGNEAFHVCQSGTGLYLYTQLGTSLVPTACPMPAPVCGSGNYIQLAQGSFEYGSLFGNFFQRDANYHNMISINIDMTKSGTSQSLKAKIGTMSAL